MGLFSELSETEGADDEGEPILLDAGLVLLLNFPKGDDEGLYERARAATDSRLLRKRSKWG